MCSLDRKDTANQGSSGFSTIKEVLPGIVLLFASNNDDLSRDEIGNALYVSVL